jgi:hypothetical protein
VLPPPATGLTRSRPPPTPPSPIHSSSYSSPSFPSCGCALMGVDGHHLLGPLNAERVADGGVHAPPLRPIALCRGGHVLMASTCLRAGPGPLPPGPSRPPWSALAWDTCCFHGFDHLADVARGERMSVGREALPVKVMLAQQGRPHRDVAGVIAGEGGVQRVGSNGLSVGQSPSPMPKVAGETRKAGHIHTRAYRGSLGGYRRENPD